MFIFFILLQPESEAGQAGAKRHAQEEHHHGVTVVTDVTGHRRLQDGAVGQRQRDPGAGRLRVVVGDHQADDNPGPAEPRELNERDIGLSEEYPEPEPAE